MWELEGRRRFGINIGRQGLRDTGVFGWHCFVRDGVMWWIMSVLSPATQKREESGHILFGEVRAVGFSMLLCFAPARGRRLCGVIDNWVVVSCSVHDRSRVINNRESREILLVRWIGAIKFYSIQVLPHMHNHNFSFSFNRANC